MGKVWWFFQSKGSKSEVLLVSPGSDAFLGVVATRILESESIAYLRPTVYKITQSSQSKTKNCLEKYEHHKTNPKNKKLWKESKQVPENKLQKHTKNTRKKLLKNPQNKLKKTSQKVTKK